MTERQKVTVEKVGDEATGKVVYVNEVKTRYGPRIAFVITIGEAEYELPLIATDTATKRLERIGLTTTTAVGETLRFWRKDNPSGRPFWEIDVANPAQSKPSSRVKPSEADPVKGLPPSFGAHIPGLDPDDGPEMAGPWDEPANDHEPNAALAEAMRENASIPKTPREEAYVTTQMARQAASLDLYTELYEAVLGRLAAAHFRVNQTMVGARATDKVALTSDTAHAATFSIFKRWCDMGLVK